MGIERSKFIGIGELWYENTHTWWPTAQVRVVRVNSSAPGAEWVKWVLERSAVLWQSNRRWSQQDTLMLSIFSKQDWQTFSISSWSLLMCIWVQRSENKGTDNNRVNKGLWHTWHMLVLIIIIMKTIYIAPKNRMNGTLSASHINSFCTHTHSHALTHVRTYTHYLSPSPSPPLSLSSLLSTDERVVL